MIPIPEDFYQRASVMLGDKELVQTEFSKLHSFQNPAWTITWFTMAEQFSAIAKQTDSELEFIKKQCAALAIACYPALTDSMRQAHYISLKRCYRNLCALEGYKIKYDEFTYDAQTVPYTFRKTHQANVKGTIFMIRGLDSFKEVRYWSENPLLEQGFNIVGIDFPGMGENPIAMTENSEHVFKALIHDVQSKYNSGTLTLCWGLGFGGYWAQKLAITHRNLVDGAINQGGPVHYGFKPNVKKLIFNFSEVRFLSSMIQLALNEQESTPKFIKKLSLENNQLLNVPSSPTLYINGDLDKTASVKEFNLLEKLPQCEAVRIRGAGHLAIDALDSKVIPKIIDWIQSLESQDRIKQVG